MDSKQQAANWLIRGLSGVVGQLNDIADSGLVLTEPMQAEITEKAQQLLSVALKFSFVKEIQDVKTKNQV